MRLALSCALVLGGSLLFGGAAFGETFSDPTKVNVLRRFDENGKFLIHTSTTATETLRNQGGDSTPSGAIDGSGWNVESVEPLFTADTDEVAQTFTLPDARRVGSYRFAFLNNTYRASSVRIEGLEDGTWQTLALVEKPAGVNTGTFDTPRNVTAIRYTAKGPGVNGNYFTLSELEVYLAKDAEAPDLRAGFNLARDPKLVSAGVTSNTAQHGAKGFYTPTGNAGNPIDNDAATTYLTNNRIPDGGQSFVTYKLNIPDPITAAGIGAYHGQVWTEWKFWTNAVNDPDPTNDEHWILQYEHRPETEPARSLHFRLARPGVYQQVRITWPKQDGAITNLELYAVPVPDKPE
jgi:hypothetical protein